MRPRRRGCRLRGRGSVRGGTEAATRRTRSLWLDAADAGQQLLWRDVARNLDVVEQTAVVDPRDAVAARGDERVVRDDDHRHRPLGPQVEEELDDLEPGLGVEVAGGLVGKQQ